MFEAHSTRDKIKNLDELTPLLASFRKQKRKIVHCHGLFDLLHIGHIRHFEQAKKLGHILVVTVTADRYVQKGPHRPAFSEVLRAEALAALDCVDYVAINHSPMAVEAINVLRPDFYVKGSAYQAAENDDNSGIVLEEAAIKSVGGQLVFTDEITFSSSNLIHHHLSLFPKEVSDYLACFATKYSPDQVLSYLERAKELKVLVVGETIIDEYLYCKTIGKSGKEPVLAAKYMERKKFAGGVLAVANHLVGFCGQVDLLTFLGTQDSQEAFICEKLAPEIGKIFLYQENAPTIVKRRFVETYPFQKLFEVYVMDDEYNAVQSQALCTKLREVLPAYDLVIVTDYGHGMIGSEAVDILCDQAHFLAVNTQLNAGNHGFNTISKYSRADYISISENEIRLEARSQRRDLHDIVLEVAENLSCERVMITRGKLGCLCYSQEEGFIEVPVFTTRVVDRVGAGDALFSLTSLCAVQKAPMEMVGFIGSAVGAQAVATVSNKKPVEPMPLFQYIRSLMK